MPPLTLWQQRPPLVLRMISGSSQGAFIILFYCETCRIIIIISSMYTILFFAPFLIKLYEAARALKHIVFTNKFLIHTRNSHPVGALATNLGTTSSARTGFGRRPRTVHASSATPARTAAPSALRCAAPPAVPRQRAFWSIRNCEKKGFSLLLHTDGTCNDGVVCGLLPCWRWRWCLQRYPWVGWANRSGARRNSRLMSSRCARPPKWLYRRARLATHTAPRAPPPKPASGGRAQAARHKSRTFRT